jgi:hypothetical protein
MKNNIKKLDDCHCVLCGRYLPEGEGMVCKQCSQKEDEPQQMSFKNIHIENSYKIWNIDDMYDSIQYASFIRYGDSDAADVLNRTYRGMYIEWYLHNIGYYLTLPFINKESIKALNKRFKHVDLEEHK